MSTLVTGGAGFIGSHLIERLLSDTDRQVVCVDNFNDYYDPKLKRANVASFVDDRRVSVVERDFRDAADRPERDGAVIETRNPTFRHFMNS